MGWDGSRAYAECPTTPTTSDVRTCVVVARRETRDARRETRNSGRARRLSSSRIVVVDARDDARDDDEDEDEDEDEDDRVIAFGGVDLKSRRAVRASSSEIGLVIDW